MPLMTNNTPNVRYQWNKAGQLSAWQHHHGTTALHYDKAGQITQVSQHRFGKLDNLGEATRKEHYQYNDNQDLIAQKTEQLEFGLTSPSASNDSIHTDAPNNTQDGFQTDWQTQSSDRQYRHGRVTHINGYHCHYDERGRLIEKTRPQANGFSNTTQRYRWNALDQLTGYEDQHGNRWAYQYDAFNRRTAKQQTHKVNQQSKSYSQTTNAQGRELANTTHYRWDGDQLIQEVPLYADGTAAWDKAVHWHYKADSFRPLAKRQNGKLFYIVNDTAGTPQALYTEQGNLVTEQKLTLWGEEDKEAKRSTMYQSTAGNNQAANDSDAYLSLRFQGQQYDTESGLHYNRHRYYDPELAQYIIADPIGLAGGLRPQGYVSDPVHWVDPLGLIGIEEIAKAKAAQLREAGVSDATKVTVVRDKVTGKAYTGVSGNPHQKIEKGLAKQMPPVSREHWAVDNCSEVDAFNKAFKARPEAKIKDMKAITITARNDKNAPACKNCQITTRNAGLDKCK